MSRGSGFALGRAPSRDAAGHSLPSDKSMQFIAVDLLCRHHTTPLATLSSSGSRSKFLDLRQHPVHPLGQPHVGRGSTPCAA